MGSEKMTSLFPAKPYLKLYETFLACMMIVFVGLISGILLVLGDKSRDSIEDVINDGVFFCLPAVLAIFFIGFPALMLNKNFSSNKTLQNILNWVDRVVDNNTFQYKMKYKDEYLYYSLALKTARLTHKYFKKYCYEYVEEDIKWLQEKTKDSRTNYLICRLSGI